MLFIENLNRARIKMIIPSFGLTKLPTGWLVPWLPARNVASSKGEAGIVIDLSIGPLA